MKTIKHKDIKNGMAVYVCGYKMRVDNVRTQIIGGKPAIRFNGYCVDSCDISNTAYNGASYGAFYNVDLIIE